MPRGKRLFKLIVKRVRGSKKGTSYTRKFKTKAEMQAAMKRYAKLGQKKGGPTKRDVVPRPTGGKGFIEVKIPAKKVKPKSIGQQVTKAEVDIRDSKDALKKLAAIHKAETRKMQIIMNKIKRFPKDPAKAPKSPFGRTLTKEGLQKDLDFIKKEHVRTAKARKGWTSTLKKGRSNLKSAQKARAAEIQKRMAANPPSGSLRAKKRVTTTKRFKR